MTINLAKQAFHDGTSIGVSARGRKALPPLVLAALLSLGACQSALTGMSPAGGWEDGATQFASARPGIHGSRLRPLELTLEPGVPFGGCLVIETVPLGSAEAGSGLIC